MAAFDEIKKRWLADEADDVETAIYLLWNETDWMEDNAYLAATQYTAMQARIEKLETENAVMYAAILEASELGNSAALRCKVELQRIARNEAK